jgi:hypothetical protein
MLSSRTETLQLVLAAHLDHSDVRADCRGAGGGLFTAGEIGRSPAALAARGVSTEHGRRRQRRRQSIYVPPALLGQMDEGTSAEEIG